MAKFKRRVIATLRLKYKLLLVVASAFNIHIQTDIVKIKMLYCVSCIVKFGKCFIKEESQISVFSQCALT